jgi:hypothetical protein
MLHDMLLVHSRTCGGIQTKKASEDQRPRIIIVAGEWSMRKRDIVAPDGRDLFPIFRG